VIACCLLAHVLAVVVFMYLFYLVLH